MRNLSRHPEDEQLLRYADGELSARQARRIKSHLESCWQCRSELEEIQNVVRECVRYRKTALQPLLPTPPAPWPDLESRFDDIDASLARPSWLNGLRPARVWAPAAAVIALACLAWYHLRQTPSVQAAELLRKAVAAADAGPVKPHRIRIRTRRNTVIRPAGMKYAETGPLEPLNVRSYQQWHDGLAAKQDEVTTVSGNYQIRTTAAAGELAAASLQLRKEDLHPVQERLEFRNQDWVEIEEMPEETAPPETTIATAWAPTPSSLPDVPANPNQFRQPAPAATVGDELSVLVALHNAGADLGDPVEVKRANGRILVAGMGVDPQRQHEIQQALGARANVDVRFSDPEPSHAAPERPVRSDAAPTAEVLALQRQIEKQLGGRSLYERFATDVLDASDSMMSRAYALRRLAERFPARVEPEMNAADRQVLHDLYREHAHALARQVAEMERLLAPVLGGIGGRAGAVAPAAAASWQSGTEELFTTARRAEMVLAVMLGVAPGRPDGDLPSQVLSSLAQLRMSADAYGPAGSSEPQP